VGFRVSLRVPSCPLWLKVLLFRSRRCREMTAILAAPTPPPPIPDGPRPRAIFAWMGRDWRGLERFCLSDLARCRRSCGPPTPPPPIPNWRRLERCASQAIPDWRGLQRFRFNWRGLERFCLSDHQMPRSPDHPIFAALCLRPSATDPTPHSRLLKTKVKVQFDRTVTERSNALFCVFQRSNPAQFQLCFSVFTVRSAEGYKSPLPLPPYVDPI
jgi:hypothetical protein